MIKKLLSLLFCSSLLIGCHQGAQQLFDGSNLNQWYAYDAQSGVHENASDLYHIDQKILRLYGKTSGYLMSKQSFSNFKLTVTYRWDTDSTLPRRINVRNSGIMYLVPNNTPDRLWPEGIQCQVKEGATGDFILLQNFELNINGVPVKPGESVVVPRFGGEEKSVGEWNTVVVEVQHGVVKQYLNGVLTNMGSHPSVTEGRILLQYEGYPLDVKSVTVQPL